MINTQIFVVQDEDKKVVAVYDNLTIANKMLPLISKKLKSECTIVSKLVNADLAIIGNDDVNQ